MFTSTVDFNRRAERWAEQNGKPVVGNCDVHRLAQLGTTYSLVDAPADADAICEAVAAGRVRVESRPLAWTEVAQHPRRDDIRRPRRRVAQGWLRHEVGHLEVGEPGVLKCWPVEARPVTVA